jgi:hypothetical protein
MSKLYGNRGEAAAVLSQRRLKRGGAKNVFFDMKEPASNVILAKKQASRTAFIYAALGFFWIIFSDTITGSLLPDDHNIVIVSIIKGLLYVTTTAVLLYFLTHNSLMKLIDYDAKRRESERSKEVFSQSPAWPTAAIRRGFHVEFVSKEHRIDRVRPGCL